jgi:hypothetical protein
MGSYSPAVTRIDIEDLSEGDYSILDKAITKGEVLLTYKDKIIAVIPKLKHRNKGIPSTPSRAGDNSYGW